MASQLLRQTIPLRRQSGWCSPERAAARKAEGRSRWRGHEAWEVGIALAEPDAGFWGVKINPLLERHKDCSTTLRSACVHTLRSIELTEATNLNHLPTGAPQHSFRQNPLIELND